jgi:hypothetical protein
MNTRTAKPGTDMRQYIRDQCDLAAIYADDGAYHSAGSILLQLSAEVAKHAHDRDVTMGIDTRPHAR